MATVAARRNQRLLLDRNIAKAVTPLFARTIRAEQKRVTAATAGISTSAAWDKAARGAVKDSAWIATVVTVWLSPGVRDLWTAQQHELGTDFAMPAEVERILTRWGTDHGKLIAETRRDRLTRLLPEVKARDRLNPDRVFRSTMRKAVRELYADVPTKAARMTLTEVQMATESVRYESARISATRTKHRLRKVWFTVGDINVRDSHRAVNGASRFVDHRGWGGRPGKFLVGGALLRYPRDPAGPPAEVIECRCFVEYRKVRRR